jgi:hypothetical protein
MDVAQVSVFLENRTGGLADVVDVLAKNGIDIHAVTLADMSDFGILRVIVEDAEQAKKVLKAAGFTADTTRVVAVEVPDRPGGLAETLAVLRRQGINIEYMYSAARKRGERAIVVLRVDELGKASGALREAGVKVLEKLEAM